MYAPKQLLLEICGRLFSKKIRRERRCVIGETFRARQTKEIGTGDFAELKYRAYHTKPALTRPPVAAEIMAHQKAVIMHYISGCQQIIKNSLIRMITIDVHRIERAAREIRQHLLRITSM
jgi:hypothetical protein